MRGQKKTILLLVIILFTMLFFLSVNVFSDESYIHPPPDKNKTLPANDGGSDGCNSSRFKCVMGGEAVQDKQTGLTWARNADIAKKAVPWQEAMKLCQDLEIGNRKGWRLPTKEELITLLDTSQSDPALPDGHPFENVKTVLNFYWTSTTYEDDSSRAMIVGMNIGRVTNNLKVFDSTIWPVLGSN